MPEQFKDWEEIKVNIIIVPLFTYTVKILEEGKERSMLSLDNIPNNNRREYSVSTLKGSLLSIDNNSPL